ncbi:MAG: HD domain-containing protein [Candidatus Eremiobacteraeota bacterium]|nr:HD domain-containing protein [Candidatus Eremiobacteraeota bacterium]
MRIGPLPKRTIPERLFQSGVGRSRTSGAIAPTGNSNQSERVTLSGRNGTFAPLKSLSGENLLRHTNRLGLDAANAAGLPASVARYFTPAEFYLLNSGDYHNAQHPINVAATVGEMAAKSGRSPERVQFLSQVALLHDADERIVLDGSGNFSTLQGAKPARVPVTLAFMDVNKESLTDRFGWSTDEFAEAKALIAATEHPLNDNAPGPGRIYGLEAYDGKNSQTVFKESLRQVASERRAALVEDAQLLRFADQSANYLQGLDPARATVSGLSAEIGVPAEALAKGTPSFLDGLGLDSEKFQDHPQAVFQGVRHDFSLQDTSTSYTADELLGFLSEEQRQNLNSVKQGLSS